MIIEKINQDYITSYKNKDFGRKNFLGLVKSEIKANELRGVLPTDENVIKTLREIKKNLEKTNTQESLREVKILDEYLPKLMSEELIEREIKEIVKNVNIGDLNVGYLMGAFNRKFKGKADNKIVVKIVKNILG